MNYFLGVLKKYAVFNGRASMAEYWYFVLFYIIFGVLLSILDGILGISSTDKSTLVSIYQLVLFLPSLAVAIRRIHDVNKSGWFILIPIYNLILTLTTGTKGANKYGPDPMEFQPQTPINPQV